MNEAPDRNASTSVTDNPFRLPETTGSNVTEAPCASIATTPIDRWLDNVEQRRIDAPAAVSVPRRHS